MDGEGYWITGSSAHKIGHMTHKWSLVIAGHVDYCESGASIGELNSVALCNLGAFVQPEERRGGSRGGAEQTDGAAELHQVCAAGSYDYVRDRHCGLKYNKY